MSPVTLYSGNIASDMMSDTFGTELSRPFGTDWVFGRSYPTLKGWAIVVPPSGRTASNSGSALEILVALEPELRAPLEGRYPT